MYNLKKIVIVLILILFVGIFIQKNILAIQYNSDVRIQKVWNTQEIEQKNRQRINNRKLYLKYNNIAINTLIFGIIICSAIVSVLVLNKNIKLKLYYIILLILTIIYFIINRYLIDTYSVTIGGLIYVKILLVLVGVLIGIFAQGKIAKILMASTPALIVILLGIIGKNINGVLNTAIIIEVFVQIILIPQYLKRSEI